MKRTVSKLSARRSLIFRSCAEACRVCAYFVLPQWPDVGGLHAFVLTEAVVWGILVLTVYLFAPLSAGKRSLSPLLRYLRTDSNNTKLLL